MRGKILNLKNETVHPYGFYVMSCSFEIPDIAMSTILTTRLLRIIQTTSLRTIRTKRTVRALEQSENGHSGIKIAESSIPHRIFLLQ